jgi:hypothetical protein
VSARAADNVIVLADAGRTENLPFWGCAVLDLETSQRFETVVRAGDLAAATRAAVDEVTRRHGVDGSDFVVYRADPLGPAE